MRANRSSLPPDQIAAERLRRLTGVSEVPEEALGHTDDETSAATNTLVSSSLEKAKQFTKAHLNAIGIVLVIALSFAAYQLLKARPSEVPATPAQVSVPTSAASDKQVPATPSADPLMQVHVTGAVKRPGVYKLPQGARVHDAIKAAGEVTAEADLGSVNLAAPISDGSQIIVARQGEASSGVVEPTSASTSGGGGPPAEGQKLNLNAATLEQFERLPGVGPVTAQRILAWREANGKFSSVDELQEVDGIGPKTFARLAPFVTV